MEVYDTLSLNFEEPITEIAKDSIIIYKEGYNMDSSTIRID